MYGGVVGRNGLSVYTFSFFIPRMVLVLMGCIIIMNFQWFTLHSIMETGVASIVGLIWVNRWR